MGLQTEARGSPSSKRSPLRDGSGAAGRGPRRSQAHPASAGESQWQQQQQGVSGAARRELAQAGAGDAAPVLAALRRLAYLDGAAAAEAVAAAEAEAAGTGIPSPSPSASPNNPNTATSAASAASAATPQQQQLQQPKRPRPSQLPQPRGVLLAHLRHVTAMPSATRLRAVMELHSGAGRWLASHLVAYPALNASSLGAWAAGANDFLELFLRRHYGMELQPVEQHQEGAVAVAVEGPGAGGRGLLHQGAGADEQDAAGGEGAEQAGAATQPAQQWQLRQQPAQRRGLQQTRTEAAGAGAGGAGLGTAAVVPRFRTVAVAVQVAGNGGAAGAAAGGAAAGRGGRSAGGGAGAMQARVLLSPGPGLPLLRRVLLSQLVTAWLTGDLTESDLAAPQAATAAAAGSGQANGTEAGGRAAAPGFLLSRMFALLYAIHRQSVEARGVLQHLHISKSGGTSWGEAADANRCVSPPTLGKHVKGFGDECRWIDMPTYLGVSRGHRILWGRWGMTERPDNARTCRQRFAAVAAPGAGYSFISNEYTLLAEAGGMYEAHLCPQFVNVVTVREPLRRQQSHLRFMLTLIRAYWLKRNPEDGEQMFDRVMCGANASFVRQLAPPVADNYMLRSFLGEAGFHSPPDSLHGPEPLAAACDQLLQFDLVLDLDAGGGVAAEVMALGLGWNTTLAEAHTLATDSLHYFRKLDYAACHPADEALREIRAAQGPDRKLYSFARLVNQLDVMWLEAAAAILSPAESTAAAAAAGRGEGLGCGWLHRGANGSALAAALGPQRLQHWLNPVA
ncbi:hypothetical protein HYH02_001009 [Chlamydomonas schloesseri]|uniref:Uncharacterized protein n=1 Tax=Chlamydomonas schloesseri TaxID=2026947 RepID=A0A835WV34_9CHLO|nr:hypothetical protein HYH02_001009 [Chlamydomonas schloesseri]|eukprot:KAG2453962.1 hypothetical protein HYH02_001009 [Chlamydomonas schloesseri]